MRFARAALAAAVLVGSLQAGAGAADKRLDGLDPYIERVRADWNNVGVAVAVVQGSEMIYARGFGVKEFGRADKIDADTLFQVGSTSKAFTTAALGILIDEGRIRWDDPVIDCLPGFQLPDPWVTRHLTIRDAVTHDSGVVDSRYSSLGVMNLDEVVRQLRSATTDAAFRNSFHYSNLMYAAAGKIIEVVSGLSWHAFVKRRLLQPLEMNRSGTSHAEFWDARYVRSTFLGSAPAGHPHLSDARGVNIAMPHAVDANEVVQVLPWINYDSKAAAGAIVTSAADMAKWVVMHLNEGRFKGRQLLKQETLNELHTTQNPYLSTAPFPFDTTSEGYAMGWYRAKYRGHTHLAHGGGIIGFPTHVAMLPDRKLGVVVLSNGPAVRGFHQAIELEIFDRLLGVSDASRRDWNRELLMRAQKTKQEAQEAEAELRRTRLQNAPPSLRLENYVGTYEDPSRQTGRVDVRVTDGQLTLSFSGEGAFSAPLEHWHHDLFRMRAEPGVADSLSRAHQFVAFSLDPSGTLASMSAFDATFRRIPDAVGPRKP